MNLTEPERLLPARIADSLGAHKLHHQEENIIQSLRAAGSNTLTETLAQNLLTAIFAHSVKDEKMVPEYVSILLPLALKHRNLRKILAKSLTKRGRCPEIFRSELRRLVSEVEKELAPPIQDKSASGKVAQLPHLADQTLPTILAPQETDAPGAFNINKLLAHNYSPLGSSDSVIPEAIKAYHASLSFLRQSWTEALILDEPLEQDSLLPETLTTLVLEARRNYYLFDAKRAKYFFALAKKYSELHREDLFKFTFSQYLFATGSSLFAAGKKKESRSYFQTILHLWYRSPGEIQRELGWVLYNSLSAYLGTYNIYVNVRETRFNTLSETFYLNLEKTIIELGRQGQFESLGRRLLDIGVADPGFIFDFINRLKTRDRASNALLIIQKALLDKNVMKAEPFLCLNLLSKIDIESIKTALSRISFTRLEERRAVTAGLIRFALDYTSPPNEMLNGFAEQASSDTRFDLAFSILVEPVSTSLLARANEIKAQLLGAIFGFSQGTEITEYFLARVTELANLLHQFTRSADPSLKGRHGYNILETIRLTRKWSSDRLRTDFRGEVMKFYRMVEGFVTSEQSKLIRDTSLEVHLATDRAVHSTDSTRVTLEIRNIGEGTADGLELEVFPVEGNYNVEERFQKYSIDILPDKTPIQKEIFLQPLVMENESIELSAVLRYNTLKEKNKLVELDKVNRTVWLYPEGQFVRVPQPYNIGEPATTWFYGRHDLLETMADNLHTQDEHDVSVIVYGLKRAGKTSVLKRFIAHTLEDKRLTARYIPIYADLIKDSRLQNVRSDSEFLYFLISIIHEKLLDAKNDKMTSFDLYRFREEFAHDPFQTFSFLLDEILAAVAPKRLLIALDEFSTLQSKLLKIDGAPILSDALFGFLSNTIQSSKQLTFIFTGTYMLLDMMRDHTIDLAKICTPYMVGFLEDNAARQLVVEPVKRDLTQPERGWLEYDPRVVERIVSSTNRHPFLIQYLCLQLVNRMNHLKHNTVNLNDLTSIIDEVVNRPMHAPTMHILWDEFDSPQHKVISTIAGRSGPNKEWVEIEEIMDTFKELGEPSSAEDVVSICASLTDAELLEMSSGSETESYRITIPMYQMWLKQNKPSKSVFFS